MPNKFVKTAAISTFVIHSKNFKSRAIPDLNNQKCCREHHFPSETNF